MYGARYICLGGFPLTVPRCLLPTYLLTVLQIALLKLHHRDHEHVTQRPCDAYDPHPAQQPHQQHRRPRVLEYGIAAIAVSERAGGVIR